MESLEDILKILAKLKLLALLKSLAEIHAQKSDLEIARAWYSVCKGHYVFPTQEGDTEEDFEPNEDDKLKLIGLVEDGQSYKFQFETTLGQVIEAGGRLHADYKLAGGQDIDVFEMSEQVYRTLSGDEYKPSEGDSPISHLLS